MAVLTLLRISLNFKGVNNETGKYPFVKILIADAYMCSWVINSLCSTVYLSCTVLKYNSEFMEEWCKPSEFAYSYLNVRELCCPANSLLSKDVVLCILCTVLISFSNVSAL